MKAKIICKSLEEVKGNLLLLCKEQGIEVATTYLPESFNRKQDYGVVYAVKDKEVLALTPYWRTDDGLYELQTDLVKSPQLRYVAK